MYDSTLHMVEIVYSEYASTTETKKEAALAWGSLFL